MPIKPDNRAKYPPDWPAISRRIRFERAGNRCERCKAPNGQIVARGDGCYMLEEGEVFSDTDGAPMGTARGSEFVATRYTSIVLTVAHLNHDPTDNREDNLQALCQRCHLLHDREHHAASARETRRRRKAAADLPGVG